MNAIWAQQTIAVTAICASATAISALVNKQSTINALGYAASQGSLDYATWNGKKVFIRNGYNIICNYSGAVKNIALPVGTYKLEVWGAEGGIGWYQSSSTTNSSNSVSGKGGYSYGSKAITNATTYYIYIGGQGSSGIDYAAYGGWNGGGGITNSINYNSNYKCGATGGGATEVGTSSNYNSSWVAKYDGGLGYGTSCTGGHQNHATALPGGGGYYGGGCGQYGGGGGSGYIGGISGGSMQNGARSGNGYAVITKTV